MYCQATNVECDIMKKIHKMYCQATNVEWEIMKKYTKCTVKLQMLNRNNEKNTQNVPSSYKC